MSRRQRNGEKLMQQKNDQQTRFGDVRRRGGAAADVSGGAKERAIPSLFVGNRLFGQSPGQGLYNRRNRQRISSPYNQVRKRCPSVGPQAPNLRRKPLELPTSVRFPSNPNQLANTAPNTSPAPINQQPQLTPFEAVVHEFSIVKQNGRINLVRLNVYDAVVVTNENTKKVSVRPVNSTRGPFIGRMVNCAVKSTVKSKEWLKSGKSLPKRILRKTTNTIRNTLNRTLADRRFDGIFGRRMDSNFQDEDRIRRGYSPRSRSPAEYFDRRQKEPVCEMRRWRRVSGADRLAKTCEDRVQRNSRMRSLSSTCSESNCSGCPSTCSCRVRKSRPPAKVTIDHDREFSLIKSTPRSRTLSWSSSSSYTSSSDDEVVTTATAPPIVPVAVVSPQSSENSLPQVQHHETLIVFSPSVSPQSSVAGSTASSRSLCRSHLGEMCPFIRKHDAERSSRPVPNIRDSERVENNSSLPESEGFEFQDPPSFPALASEWRSKKQPSPLRYSNFCSVHKRDCHFEGTSKTCTFGYKKMFADKPDGQQKSSTLGSKTNVRTSAPVKQERAMKTDDNRVTSLDSWKSVRSPFNSPVERERKLQDDVTRQLLHLEPLKVCDKSSESAGSSEKLRKEKSKSPDNGSKNDIRQNKMAFSVCADCPTPDLCAGVSSCLRSKSRDSHDGARKTVSFDSTNLEKPRSVVSERKTKSADSYASSRKKTAVNVTCAKPRSNGWVPIKSSESPRSPSTPDSWVCPRNASAPTPSSPEHKKWRIDISIIVNALDDVHFNVNGASNSANGHNDKGKSQQGEKKEHSPDDRTD